MKLPTLLLVPFLIQCSSLPRPGEGEVDQSFSQSSREILRLSAKTHGDPWQRYGKVTVRYDGKWAPLVNRIQPDLVDAGFRKTSIESYDTRQGTVQQLHSAEEGTKCVVRTRSSVTVNYTPAKEITKAQSNASALVTDAYTAFLFGPSWILENADELTMLQAQSIEGRKCHLIQGKLKPGFGFSVEDHFIVWIDRQSRLFRRLQLTLGGLASAAGADVSVTFSNFATARDGSIWPTHFVEYVERPFNIKAHEWDLLSLNADGRTLFKAPVNR